MTPGGPQDRLRGMTQVDKRDRPIGPIVENWTPPPIPAKTEMPGRYANVVPFDLAAHSRQLYDLNAADDAIWDYMPQGPFASFNAYRDWMADNALGADPMFHTIINLETGRAEGVATYLRIAPDAGSIEVGYITYSPALQRTRAGTEAMILMMRRAFDLGYRRYEWKCNALNQPSRNLAMRLGMSFEGVFRQAAVVKERNRDTAWYAAIDKDWPAISDAFDAWLDPSNFDADGRQKTSLSDLTRPLLVNIG